MFRSVFRYARPLVVHNGLQWALNSADRLILVRVLGPEALGGYFFAYQFGSGLKLVGRSINSSIIHIYSELAADPAAGPRARTAANAFLGFVLLIMVGVGCLAPWVVGLTAWDKFDGFLYLVPLVSAGAAIYLLYFLPMNVLSLTLGKSGRLYIITLIAAAVSVGLNLLLVPLGVVFAGVVNVISFSVLTVGFLLLLRASDGARDFLPLAPVVRTMVAILALGALAAWSLTALG
jgi:O-antigen/teichoic acid export membrane protein